MWTTGDAVFVVDGRPYNGVALLTCQGCSNGKGKAAKKSIDKARQQFAALICVGNECLSMRAKKTLAPIFVVTLLDSKRHVVDDHNRPKGTPIQGELVIKEDLHFSRRACSTRLLKVKAAHGTASGVS